MKKTIIKIAIFLFVFCILFYYVSNVLWINKQPIAYFYKEPKNSLDVVYVGASNVYQQFNASLAYYLYGYKTGILSSSEQPFPTIEYLIKESEKYQSPELYVIDITRVIDDLSNLKEGAIRKTTDFMKFSKNRIDAINKLLKNIGTKKSEYINYYFSFLMYHNRYKSIYGNLIKYNTLYKGYLFVKDTTIIQPQDEYIWNKNMTELEEENNIILYSLIDYIKDKNINVLFIVPKRYYETKENEKINQIIKILQENKLTVINFNTLEDFNNIIDFNTDFYNARHLNVYGATKYTLYFAKYLKENYQLQDHREDEKYSSWSTEYERFKKDFNKLTNKNFDELLLEYKKTKI